MQYHKLSVVLSIDWIGYISLYHNADCLEQLMTPIDEAVIAIAVRRRLHVGLDA